MSLLGAFAATLRAGVRDEGVALFLLIAVPIYSFFYPMAYSTEAVRHIPVVVVDQDASPVSRDILTRLEASPAIRVVGRAAAVGEASEALAAGRIAGIVLVPFDFQRDALAGTGTAVTVFGSGAYPVQDKAVLESVGEVVAGVAAANAALRLARQGVPAEALVQAARNPGPYAEQPLYNLARGYGSYVVTAVSILIVQQIMLIGIAALVATWLERREGPLFGPDGGGLAALGGTVLALTLFPFAALLYFFGFAYWFHDYPRGGNFPGALALAALMAATIACLGIALGAWVARRERAVQVLLTLSIPFLFASGIVFPRESIPAPLDALAALVPTTPGILGFVKLNQMGAAWSEVRPEYAGLAAQFVVYATLALWGVGRRRVTPTCPCA